MPCNAQRNAQPWERAAEALAEYPPSVKFVAKVLDVEGELSQQRLVEETLLPVRTVRYAVNTLEQDGHLESRHCFRDARKRLYSLDLD
ncbi:ArsR family transcriptional regulator [Haloarchaeobius amylolyticus]|uniref:ArsR family transcriptional regulator n=1 Tax=Haloarchaeobius amylolyticus TaxID=1198296 RepID=UPI00226E27FE|nr:ArsR family transcriptional regulator [Haloarchaeobius amylolyticus]